MSFFGVDDLRSLAPVALLHVEGVAILTDSELALRTCETIRPRRQFWLFTELSNDHKPDHVGMEAMHAKKLLVHQGELGHDARPTSDDGCSLSGGSNAGSVPLGTALLLAFGLLLRRQRRSKP